ncbi:MAG: SUMF1/EgtB/PvdO family nonheme iron enzyme [Lewinella sp.]|nr:SUMF1/EgtB/PvdO family nonheme iron enzyme [Lewinella sp.]
MNMNYIPSLVILYQHYQQQANEPRAEYARALAEDIAGRVARSAEVQLYFTPTPLTSIQTHMDLRGIEKDMMPITASLYASATEVSNAAYEAFLQDLLQERRFELLSSCQIRTADWRSLLPAPFQNLPETTLFAHAHPDDPSSPIVNITHEAARAYCEWLTEMYNRSDHRRKQFSKVRFRLPTEEEWQLAARAGRGGPYPWGGPYYRNIKGCYLANFNPYLSSPQQGPAATCDTQPAIAVSGESISPGDDGGFFPVHVGSYSPNDFGLYNCSGNVAEMVSEPGITRGGGWMDSSEFIQLGVRNEATLPSPNVGFRIFMEVIEE